LDVTRRCNRSGECRDPSSARSVRVLSDARSAPNRAITRDIASLARTSLGHRPVWTTGFWQRTADRFGQTRPAAAWSARFSSKRSARERKTARSTPIASRKPRIMTARAFTLPAETSIVLARKNSGEAQVNADEATGFQRFVVWLAKRRYGFLPGILRVLITDIKVARAASGLYQYLHLK